MGPMLYLYTHKGTFRGLHYQNNPSQTKYIKVVKGSIIDLLYNLNTGELQHFVWTDVNKVKDIIETMLM